MNDILEDFFSKTTEKRMNKALLYYKDNTLEAREYVNQIIRVPLESFVFYVNSSYPKQIITSKDVIQFSNFEDATSNICTKLKEKNNPGMKFAEMGRLLLDDGKERKEGAYVKYGENHAKTACSLGLMFEFYKTYYLSCVGDIFVELNDIEKERMLVRLIIRSSLISRMIQASQNGNINMKEFLYMLSDSTYLRRKSNVKKVVDYLYKSDEYNFEGFIERINY